MKALATTFIVFVSIFCPSCYSDDRYNSIERKMQIHRTEEGDHVNTGRNVLMRMRRATGMKEWVERAERVARIMNGIALQTGLMTGKIPVDSAAAELLHFGNVSASEISNFKQSRITAVTEKMKHVKQDASPATYEQHVLALDKIREDSKDFGPMNTFLAIDFKPFEQFRQNFNFNLLTEGHTHFKEVKEKFKEATDLFKKKVIALSEQPILRGRLMFLYEKSKMMEPLLKSISNSTNIASSLEPSRAVFKPVENMVELTKSRNSIDSTLPSDPDTVNNQFKVVSFLVSAWETAKNDLELVKQLMIGRTHARKQKRKYTSGLANGNSDLALLSNDLRDPWFSGMVNNEELVKKLETALKSIQVIHPKFDQVDGRLQSVATTMQGSVDQIDQLQKLFTGGGISLQEATNTFIAMQKCHTNAPSIPTNHFDTIRKVLDKADPLINASSKIVELAAKSDTFLKEIPQLLVYYQDLTSNTTFEKSFEIMTKINSTNFEEQVVRIQKLFEELSIVNVETLAKDVVDGKNDVVSLPNDTKLEKEFEMYGCLKNLAGNAEKLVLMVRIAEQTRLIKADFMTNLDLIASMISGISSEWPGIQSIPDTMNREAGAESKTLSLMEDLLESSETVGVSTRALRNMYEFGQLGPSVGVLEDDSDLVTRLITEVSEPREKTEMENSWTNHGTGVTTMKAQLASIRNIENTANPSEAKDLKSFGELFTQLTGIVSVGLDAEKELEVVNRLIESVTNSSEKTRLGNLKTELTKLSPLDLQFSNFHTAIQASPSALSSFETFLAKYLRNEVAGAESTSDSGSFPLLAIIIGGIVSVVVILLIIVGVVLYKIYFIRPGKQPSTEDDIKAWIAKQAFPSLEAAEKYHRQIFEKMSDRRQVKDKASLKYLPLSKMRYPDIFCNPATAVTVKRGEKTIAMHANKFVTRNGTSFIATQAPLAGPDGTLEDFIDMVLQQGSEYVVMLCKSDDGTTVCPKYVPDRDETIEVGRFKLTSQRHHSICNTEAIKRVIMIEDTTGAATSKTITHVQFNEWPDEFIPIMPHSVIEIVQLVNKSKTPIVVHCSSGVGRSVSFIAIESISQDVAAEKSTDFRDAMLKLKSFRWHSLQDWTQSYYTQLAVVYKLGLDFELEKLDEYHRQYVMQSKLTEDRDRTKKGSSKKSSSSSKSSDTNKSTKPAAAKGK